MFRLGLMLTTVLKGRLAILDHMPHHSLHKLIFPGSWHKGKNCVESIDLYVIPVRLSRRWAWPRVPDPSKIV